MTTNGERNLVAIEKVNGQWQASASELAMETMPSLRSVVVRTSARGAMAQAGIPVEIRESLNELLADVLNLNNLKPGDTIRLLYNSLDFRGQEMATRRYFGGRSGKRRPNLSGLLFCPSR